MSPRLLLLIDGLGALLSATLINALPDVGIPTFALRGLTLAATVMASYSLTCCLSGRVGRPYVRTIALINAAYCAITLALLVWYRSTLTSLGLLYFGAEVLIISVLIRFEWRSSGASVRGRTSETADQFHRPHGQETGQQSGGSFSQ